MVKKIWQRSSETCTSALQVCRIPERNLTCELKTLREDAEHIGHWNEQNPFFELTVFILIWYIPLMEQTQIWIVSKAVLDV